jgi:hypothetical protein
MIRKPAAVQLPPYRRACALLRRARRIRIAYVNGRAGFVGKLPWGNQECDVF